MSLVATGENLYDVKRLELVLKEIVIDRPPDTEKMKQNLCADKGYSGKPTLKIILVKGYIPT